MTRAGALAILLAFAGALAFRLPDLAKRPFHNDEAVNAVKVSELWERGRYAYDPDEYHGPSLHYFTLPFLWAGPAKNAGELSDAALRLAPVFFGAGLILLLLLFSDGLGRPAIWWAALFTAVSPAMVFYSRYFIHEMLLVFFTALLVGTGWRYLQTRALHWAVAAGISLGLMAATKETFVLAVVAMVLAGAGAVLWKTPGRAGIERMRLFWNWRHFALFAGAAGIIWLVFFTSFFTHAAGPLDSIRTYFPWLKRAGGHSPHIHPWHFYFERLAWFHPPKSPVWSEALVIILAGVGLLTAFARNRPLLVRFIALYSVILAGIYSAISYKTPWCLLGFYHGVILLAGVGATALLNACRQRALKVAFGTVVLLLTAQLGAQAWRASFVFSADRRNPYVYAQTVPNILELVQKAEGVARVAPAGRDTVVKVIAADGDYWPLPWYLRRFPQTGWYEKIPDDPFAPIVVVSSQLGAQLDERSNRKWIMAGLFELRPGKFFELYVELDLWRKYVETLPRNRDEE